MILLTGASGFVGRAILKRLSGAYCLHIRTYGRTVINEHSIPHIIGEIGAKTDYSSTLSGVDVIIHAAARTHVMNDSSIDPFTEYYNINVAGTLNLARQAVNAGVRRFVFLSSIKVNGELTSVDDPFKNTDCIHPCDPYSISKAEAEAGLREIAKKSGMEVVIIRPPLVYGPGVKANFAAMMNCVKRNFPLPLGAIKNKRSLVALDNLVDLIITCVYHPNAANQTFLVSDDQDVSTTELLKKMATAFGKKSKLIPIPMGLIQFIARLLGRKAVAQRLCSSLLVDISHTKETLNWKPPVTMEQQLAKIATSLSQITTDN